MRIHFFRVQPGKVTPPSNPTGGETAENPFDMLERLLRLKKLATESQSDSLAAKTDKRIKILENELFPDL